MTADLEKMIFGHFHMYADFAAKWVNYYIWGVLMSYYDDFQPFKGLLRNSKKLKFSMTADLEKNVIFGHTFADFAAKWVNNYIWGVLMSYYDDFLPF